MCLYPKLILNRKYLPNKKNGGNVPIMKDERTGWVPVGCNKCIECKKQKSRMWSVRLQEHIREDSSGNFVTLTFSNKSIKKIKREINKEIKGYELDNEIAKLAVRRFLERWRKEHGKSVTHFLITEIGEGETKADNIKLQGDGNIHLHGIIFTKHQADIERIWKYGFVYIGQYVNDETVNYTVKYFTQVDENHKEYNPIILTSPGIGSSYTKRLDAKTNKYKPGKTDETYTTRQGAKMNLPIYYRNKIYTDDEKEKLWLEKLDKQERWVMGAKISTKNGPEQYYEELKHARKKNKFLGYGDDETDWNRKDYEEKRRELNMKKRLDTSEEM